RKFQTPPELQRQSFVRSSMLSTHNTSPMNIHTDQNFTSVGTINPQPSSRRNDYYTQPFKKDSLYHLPSKDINYHLRDDNSSITTNTSKSISTLDSNLDMISSAYRIPHSPKYDVESLKKSMR